MGSIVGDGQGNQGQAQPHPQADHSGQTARGGQTNPDNVAGGQDLSNVFGSSSKSDLQQVCNFRKHVFQNVPENNFKHAVVQNGKLWAMTEKSDNVIARVDLSNPSQREAVDEHFKKKNVQKMCVDREGLHCILVSDFELYYLNWSDNQVHKISNLIQQKAKSSSTAYITGQRPTTITALDI